MTTLAARTPLGLAARALSDLITPHLTVQEATKGRGWWPDDVEGEAARYERLASRSFEVAREILGCPITIISGARSPPSRRPSSMHLPPVQRSAPALRYLSRAPADRGAALDMVPQGVACDVAFRLLDDAMRAGRLPPGGLFWYASDAANPGPPGGRFIHLDNRGTIAREAKLTPPRRA